VVAELKQVPEGVLLGVNSSLTVSGPALVAIEDFERQKSVSPSDHRSYWKITTFPKLVFYFSAVRIKLAALCPRMAS
jgi:hypothetical protein